MQGALLFAALISSALALTEAPGPLESRLQHRLLAPCCYQETPDHHMSEEVVKMKTEIHAMVGDGRSEREIVEFYKTRYGSRILAEPEGAAWRIGTITPLVVLAVGAAVLVHLLRKWSRPSLRTSLPIILLAAIFIWSYDRTAQTTVHNGRPTGAFI